LTKNYLHPWFIKGHSAFSRAFPHLVSQVPFNPFYVCPQCLRAFGADAWDHKVITRDHVPPESIDGQRLTLTCQPCNNHVGGSDLDSHMRLEADFYDFLSGNLDQTRAHLTTHSGTVPIQITVTDGSIKAFGVPEAVHPDEHQRVMSSFDEATQEGGWEDFRITFEFKPFSKERAATGWLRTAYLAFFATLGYRFVMRPELHEVRAKFRDPENHGLRNFRVTTPTFTREPTLVRIDSPDAFRSYAMLYRHHVVFLPRYGDSGLYERLGAEGEHVQVTFSGKGYPWPAGSPTFFHDWLDT
jgi:hypothetical protein